MPTGDLLIKDASIVFPWGITGASVLADGGSVVSLAIDDSSFHADKVVNASGLFLLPGAIDAHVHVMEGITRETWETATRAASVGGVTTLIDHPIGNPNIFDARTFAERLKEAERGAVIDFAFHGACKPTSPELIPELIDLGVTTFKAFTTGDWLGPPFDNYDIYHMARYIGERGGVLGLHAEDDSIVKSCTEEMKKKKTKATPSDFAKSRPPIAEILAVSSALNIAHETNSPIHFFHVSCGESVQLIRKFKARGTQVTAETHPQFLLLSDKIYSDDKLGRAAKMNPPIKSEKDRLEIWKGIRDGTISLITTDHSPWAKEEKYLDDIWEAKPGFPGVETLLPLMLAEVIKQNISFPELVRILSFNPARVFGLDGKGLIAPGFDADFVLVDIKKSKVVHENELTSAAKQTPFDGFEACPPLMTFSRGELVAEDGTPISGKASGRFLKRKASKRAHLEEFDMYG